MQPDTQPTPAAINTALAASGRPHLPGARATNLARALSQAIDDRDVQEIAWRARDGWLYWDYGCWRAATCRVPPVPDLSQPLPPAGSMAAHDRLALSYDAWLQSVAVSEIDDAWDALSRDAGNCGLPMDEPDMPAWAQRRVAAYGQLMGFDLPVERRPIHSRFTCSQSAQENSVMTVTPTYEPLGETPFIAPSETKQHDLILASRVRNTAVYNRADEHIGHVADLSIDKASGQTLYALIAFGGFLGLGEQLHPMPWGALTYDPNRLGYVVSLTKDQLKTAPSLTSAEMEDLGAGDAWRARLNDYYASYGYPMV